MPSTERRRTLADYCEWWPLGELRPCYAPATLVLVRPSGETLTFSCAAHRDGWAARIQGRYLVLERDEWEASGGGYRGGAGRIGHAQPGPALRGAG
jgi:hypothetical protein